MADEEVRRKKVPIGTILFIFLSVVLNTFFLDLKLWIFISSLVVIISSYHALRIRHRGYFWIDKQGNKLKFKEFMRRWALGIQGITPLQQAKTSLLGVWIVITGIIWGIVVTWIAEMWWLLIVLVGSLIVTAVQLLSTWQKFKTYKRIAQAQKEAESRMQEMQQ